MTEFRWEILVKNNLLTSETRCAVKSEYFCNRMNKRKWVWRLWEKNRKRGCTEWMTFFWSLEVKACQKCFKKPYAQVGSKSVSSQVRTSVTQASLWEPLKKKILGSRLLPQYVTFDACWWKARTSLPFVLFFFCLFKPRKSRCRLWNGCQGAPKRYFSSRCRHILNDGGNLSI